MHTRSWALGEEFLPTTPHRASSTSPLTPPCLSALNEVGWIDGVTCGGRPGALCYVVGVENSLTPPNPPPQGRPFFSTDRLVRKEERKGLLFTAAPFHPPVYSSSLRSVFAHEREGGRGREMDVLARDD